jgi:hypothetical protein
VSALIIAPELLGAGVAATDGLAALRVALLDDELLDPQATTVSAAPTTPAIAPSCLRTINLLRSLRESR